jgi:putative NIF3 family GTP cyclohydrolase 1 type 2
MIDTDFSRREMLWSGAFAALATSVPSLVNATPPKIVTAADLNAYLKSLNTGTGFDFDTDRITFGDPNRAIRSVATMWQGFLPDLRQMHAAGHNVVIVHEPILYTHKDLDPGTKEYSWASPKVVALFEAARLVKERFLTESGMTIIRCHDMLDTARTYGIPFAWGRLLGFRDADIIARAQYYHSYRIAPARAIDVARAIARGAARVGQPGIEFYGDQDRIIRSVGVGTGAISSPLSILALDPTPDIVVSITDSVRAWIEPAFARDTGLPLVVVNHGTAEESGMAELTRWLNTQNLGFPIAHHVQGCAYRWVTNG